MAGPTHEFDNNVRSVIRWFKTANSEQHQQQRLVKSINARTTSAATKTFQYSLQDNGPAIPRWHLLDRFLHWYRQRKSRKQHQVSLVSRQHFPAALINTANHVLSSLTEHDIATIKDLHDALGTHQNIAETHPLMFKTQYIIDTYKSLTTASEKKPLTIRPEWLNDDNKEILHQFLVSNRDIELDCSALGTTLSKELATITVAPLTLRNFASIAGCSCFIAAEGRSLSFDLLESSDPLESASTLDRLHALTNLLPVEGLPVTEVRMRQIPEDLDLETFDFSKIGILHLVNHTVESKSVGDLLISADKLEIDFAPVVQRRLELQCLLTEEPRWDAPTLAKELEDVKGIGGMDHIWTAYNAGNLDEAILLTQQIIEKPASFALDFYDKDISPEHTAEQYLRVVLQSLLFLRNQELDSTDFALDYSQGKHVDQIYRKCVSKERSWKPLEGQTFTYLSPDGKLSLNNLPEGVLTDFIHSASSIEVHTLDLSVVSDNDQITTLLSKPGLKATEIILPATYAIKPDILPEHDFPCHLQGGILTLCQSMDFTVPPLKNYTFSPAESTYEAADPTHIYTSDQVLAMLEHITEAPKLTEPSLQISSPLTKKQCEDLLSTMPQLSGISFAEGCVVTRELLDMIATKTPPIAITGKPAIDAKSLFDGREAAFEHFYGTDAIGQKSPPSFSPEDSAFFSSLQKDDKSFNGDRLVVYTRKMKALIDSKRILSLDKQVVVYTFAIQELSDAIKLRIANRTVNIGEADSVKLHARPYLEELKQQLAVLEEATIRNSKPIEDVSQEIDSITFASTIDLTTLDHDCISYFLDRLNEKDSLASTTVRLPDNATIDGLLLLDLLNKGLSIETANLSHTPLDSPEDTQALSKHLLGKIWHRDIANTKATQIQKVFRGWQERRHLAAEHKAATRIQKITRGRLPRRKYHAARNAARVVTRTFRRFSSRNSRQRHVQSFIFSSFPSLKPIIKAHDPFNNETMSRLYTITKTIEERTATIANIKDIDKLTNRQLEISSLFREMHGLIINSLYPHLSPEGRDEMLSIIMRTPGTHTPPPDIEGTEMRELFPQEYFEAILQDTSSIEDMVATPIIALSPLPPWINVVFANQFYELQDKSITSLTQWLSLPTEEFSPVEGLLPQLRELQRLQKEEHPDNNRIAHRLFEIHQMLPDDQKHHIDRLCSTLQYIHNRSDTPEFLTFLLDHNVKITGERIALPPDLCDRLLNYRNLSIPIILLPEGYELPAEVFDPKWPTPRCFYREDQEICSIAGHTISIPTKTPIVFSDLPENIRTSCLDKDFTLYVDHPIDLSQMPQDQITPILLDKLDTNTIILPTDYPITSELLLQLKDRTSPCKIKGGLCNLVDPSKEKLHSYHFELTQAATVIINAPVEYIEDALLKAFTDPAKLTLSIPTIKLSSLNKEWCTKIANIRCQTITFNDPSASTQLSSISKMSPLETGTLIMLENAPTLFTDTSSLVDAITCFQFNDKTPICVHFTEDSGRFEVDAFRSLFEEPIVPITLTVLGEPCNVVLAFPDSYDDTLINDKLSIDPTKMLSLQYQGKAAATVKSLRLNQLPEVSSFWASLKRSFPELQELTLPDNIALSYEQLQALADSEITVVSPVRVDTAGLTLGKASQNLARIIVYCREPSLHIPFETAEAKTFLKELAYHLPLVPMPSPSSVDDDEQDALLSSAPTPLPSPVGDIEFEDVITLDADKKEPFAETGIKLTITGVPQNTTLDEDVILSLVRKGAVLTDFDNATLRSSGDVFFTSPEQLMHICRGKNIHILPAKAEDINDEAVVHIFEKETPPFTKDYSCALAATVTLDLSTFSNIQQVNAFITKLDHFPNITFDSINLPKNSELAKPILLAIAQRHPEGKLIEIKSKGASYDFRFSYSEAVTLQDVRFTLPTPSFTVTLNKSDSPETLQTVTDRTILFFPVSLVEFLGIETLLLTPDEAKSLQEHINYFDTLATAIAEATTIAQLDEISAEIARLADLTTSIEGLDEPSRNALIEKLGSSLEAKLQKIREDIETTRASMLATCKEQFQQYFGLEEHANARLEQFQPLILEMSSMLKEMERHSPIERTSPERALATFIHSDIGPLFAAEPEEIRRAVLTKGHATIIEHAHREYVEPAEMQRLRELEAIKDKAIESFKEKLTQVEEQLRRSDILEAIDTLKQLDLQKQEYKTIIGETFDLDTELSNLYNNSIRQIGVANSFILIAHQWPSLGRVSKRQNFLSILTSLLESNIISSGQYIYLSRYITDTEYDPEHDKEHPLSSLDSALTDLHDFLFGEETTPRDILLTFGVQQALANPNAKERGEVLLSVARPAINHVLPKTPEAASQTLLSWLAIPFKETKETEGLRGDDLEKAQDENNESYLNVLTYIKTLSSIPQALRRQADIISALGTIQSKDWATTRDFLRTIQIPVKVVIRKGVVEERMATLAELPTLKLEGLADVPGDNGTLLKALNTYTGWKQDLINLFIENKIKTALTPILPDEAIRKSIAKQLVSWLKANGKTLSDFMLVISKADDETPPPEFGSLCNQIFQIFPFISTFLTSFESLPEEPSLKEVLPESHPLRAVYPIAVEA